MRVTDIKELSRRMSKDGCTFTRMCGCYVNANKDIVTTLNETFLNLEDTEFYKYLDIAKAVLKGKLGNNLIEVGFEETKGQQSLLNLRGSKLKDNDLLHEAYYSIIENYDSVGNYLILFFHDVYDVITKTSDGEKLDESEEVFEYILCAVCPVGLSKPGLGYREDDNRIGVRVRDWVVGAPETGFLWPAFTDRQEDREKLLFFTKDAKAPHHELEEGYLKAKPFLTLSERHESLKNIIKGVLDEDVYYNKLNERLFDMVAYADIVNGEEQHPVVDEEKLKEILDEIGIPERQVTDILNCYEETCSNIGYPRSVELLDEKAAKEAQKETAQEWRRNRVNRLKEYLKMAYEQLKNPDEQKEAVCSSIAEMIAE